MLSELSHVVCTLSSNVSVDVEMQLSAENEYPNVVRTFKLQKHGPPETRVSYDRDCIIL